MNLIVENPKIHKELFKRWEELDLKPVHIIKDAEERGMVINASSMSKYKSAVKYDKDGSVKSMNFKNSLTPIQLVWVCIRWGIFINIEIGEPVIKGDKVEFKVMPFNELKCLRKLRH